MDLKWILADRTYLIAYDTDIDDLYTSAIPMQRLAHDIKSRVHCDRVIIFLDACHSGATENGGKGLIRTGVDAGETERWIWAIGDRIQQRRSNILGE